VSYDVACNIYVALGMGAEPAEIKRQYRQMQKWCHPVGRCWLTQG
jgi:hypothetical protein